MGDFIPFQDLIPRALAKFRLTREARAAQVCNRFREAAPGILGTEAAGHLRPKYLKGGILYVAVPNSAWAQQVHVHRTELALKINLGLEKDRVKELRTVVEASAKAGQA